VFLAHFILYVVLFQNFIKNWIFFLTLIILLKIPCSKDPGISTAVGYKTLLAPLVTCTMVLSLLVTVLFAQHDSGCNIRNHILLDHGRKWLGGMAKPKRATWLKLVLLCYIYVHHTYVTCTWKHSSFSKSSSLYPVATRLDGTIQNTVCILGLVELAPKYPTSAYGCNMSCVQGLQYYFDMAQHETMVHPST
jgi:hypothetical protein